MRINKISFTKKNLTIKSILAARLRKKTRF
jgi:hypothetical protein